MRQEDYLYPINIGDLLPQQIFEAWKLEGVITTFDKGAFISQPGRIQNKVYFILDGYARIFHIHPEGKECILGVLTEGDLIDILQLFSEKESQLFAKALTQVRVLQMDKEKVKHEVIRNPQLSEILLHYLSNRLQSTIEVLEQVAYGKVEERLLFLLDKLTNKSKAKGEWYPVPAFITHKDLAGMIASTRETVTFLINKLIQSKKLKQENQRIWLKK